MSMSSEVREQLAKRREAKRRQRIEDERIRSDAILQQSRERGRLRNWRRRAEYFRAKYGDDWRDVMAARAAGADDDPGELDEEREAQLLHRQELAFEEGRLF